MEMLQKIANLVRDPNVSIDTTAFVIALLISLVVSFGLSLLYRIFFEDRATGSQIHRSFILLGPAITAIFIAIQYSLPLSLGLLGALSIIRFRTPIKEPEEVGFIMLLCACSVITATFKFLLLFALLVTTTVGLVIKKYLPKSRWSSLQQDGVVLVSFDSQVGAEDDAFPQIIQTLQNHLNKGKIESFSEHEGTATIQFSFCDLNVDTISELRKVLSVYENVTSVNFYFNKASQLI